MAPANFEAIEHPLMINDLEKIAAAWPLLLIALFSALGLLFAFFASIHAGTRLQFEWMGAYFIGVPISLAIGVVITQRNLALGEDSPFRPDLGDAAAGNWASRIITLICLAIAFERIVRFMLHHEYRTASGKGVVLALMGYIVSVNVLAAIFGARFGEDSRLKKVL